MIIDQSENSKVQNLLDEQKNSTSKALVSQLQILTSDSKPYKKDSNQVLVKNS